MTAISKTWVNILNGQIDPDSPIDTALMTALRDDLVFLLEWLGASYTAGAVQNHDHDGVNSALVPIGANYLRNGSFESGTSGWTISQYTGGTVAINTTVPLDGAQSLAFTSTVLANGGGDAISNEYIPCVGGVPRPVLAVVQASVANVSAKVEIIWYDNAKTQISASTVWSSASTPTTPSVVGSSIAAPSNARWMRIKITGGIPATGSATGTIYFDGLINAGNSIVPVSVGADYITIPSSTTEVTTSMTTATEVFNSRTLQSGTYRVRAMLKCTGGYTGNYQVYKNGVAAGALHSVTGTVYTEFTDDIACVAGDTIQIYAYSSTAVQPTYVKDFSFGITQASGVMSAPPCLAYLGER